MATDSDQAAGGPAGEPDILRVRVTMALAGALAGAATWLFVDVLPDRIEDDRLVMFGTALVMGFFAVLLALTGPARLLRAGVAAALLALLAAMLLYWASLRFDVVDDFLQGGLAPGAYVVLLVVATPFLAAGLQESGGWRRYALLFETSWTILVRYAAAWLFVGVFWGVLMLSNTLLEIVDIDIIDRLLDIEWVPYVLAGLVLGLALSVVHELREFVSPFLIIRLLRLLLPVVLAVVGLFILALPFQGLSGLFGSFSPAATLMGMAAAGITLVTTALDKSDDEAVRGRAMRLVVRVLAVLLPVLAGLAIYAIWLRVAQYGWTPDRLAAALAAAFVLLYAGLYALLVLLRRDWPARIRQANTVMAMAVIGAAALWLTPVLNAERISTGSQVARFLNGKSDLETAAFWDMAHAWGRAGQAGLDRLAAMEERADHAALVARIDAAGKEASRWRFESGRDASQHAAKAAALQAMMPVRPVGARLPEGALEGLTSYQLTDWQSACERRLPDDRPGCVVIVVPFNPADTRLQGLVLLNHRGGDAVAFSLGDGQRLRPMPARDIAASKRAEVTPQMIGLALDGAFTIAPASLQSLRIGGREIISNN